ncbi:MAG: hypothetical protein AAF503_09495, partial [Pseudomonadota bacterium]
KIQLVNYHFSVPARSIRAAQALNLSGFDKASCAAYALQSACYWKFSTPFIKAAQIKRLSRAYTSCRN